ncbi:phospholipid-transporting ATPase ABCA3-like [Ruditapes philippinarum]|uniref:phospholipid-transporting ATPase ABCA3-like n=1 Tax=Ruditapes philippinarum TaxID=129788 RepID=UPI00295BFEC5|nr:phospholipid-transporting ATPase ABCA3-like [Ruditapes philippinarum]
MDKAETLGDRILIIADDKLKCAGTPSYFKSKLGDGYRLCILKDEGMHTNGPSELNGNKDAQILTMVKQIIPAAFISKHVDNEVHMTIPVQTDEHFVPLFRLLENKKSELGIASYGISDSGLEQVFVKVTKSGEEDSWDCLHFSPICDLKLIV